MAVIDRESLLRRARERYEVEIRSHVDTIENLGKMLVIDPDTGDFELSDDGLEANHRMQARHPDAVLVGLRIGDDVVEEFGARSPESVKAW